VSVAIVSASHEESSSQEGLLDFITGCAGLCML
jgi:hypothetical protein